MKNIDNFINKLTEYIENYMQFNNQIEYWNSASQGKKFTTFLDFDLISRYIQPSSLIIDYGCGYGRTMDELYSLGYKNLTGFDFASDMIERGKIDFPHLDLKTSVNNQIDCSSNSVDLVLLFGVLTCIIDNQAQKELIAEIKRVLKPVGMIYINDFLINADDRNIARYNKFKDKYGAYGIFELEEGAILRHHDENWIFELTADYTTETYKTVQFNTMNGHISNGFTFLGRKNVK